MSGVSGEPTPADMWAEIEAAKRAWDAMHDCHTEQDRYNCCLAAQWHEDQAAWWLEHWIALEEG